MRKKAIHVTHCPTAEMVGDFFTKPLQGSLFIKMRNYIMGDEEPGYHRRVLNNHGSTGIRKQKFIGTRKLDSEPATCAKIRLVQYQRRTSKEHQLR